MTRIMIVLLWAVATLLCVCCAGPTPYRPASGPVSYGYHDIPSDNPNRNVIGYRAAPDADPEVAIGQWWRRVYEICRCTPDDRHGTCAAVFQTAVGGGRDTAAEEPSVRPGAPFFQANCRRQPGVATPTKCHPPDVIVCDETPEVPMLVYGAVECLKKSK